MRLVDVILPLAIGEGAYTYAVPDNKPFPAVGARVLVPIGTKEITGIVLREHTAPLRESITLREVIDVLDEPSCLWVTPEQLRLWQWVADYYMCTLGEVLVAALPAGITDDNYTARTVTYLRLRQGVDLDTAKASLSRAPKQRKVLDTYLRLAGEEQEVEKRLLVEESGQSVAAVRALVERKILDEYGKNCTRLQPFTGTVEPAHSLSSAQQEAKEEIARAFLTKDVCLLQGVTSSGKTEVYIHLIREQLALGKQVLYLVPEIALTTQLTSRMQRVFGDDLLVYHSRFTDAERVEIYRSVLENNAPKVLIGVRSSVFLPLRNLGLVIVDEEHETSYKQQEPAPRYHARSVAIMLAHWQWAKVLLGSATPSVESYHNARTGKYGLVRLTERYAGLQLPKITVIDLQRQYHRKEMYDHFSDPLVERIRQELDKQKQVILFQNRRGYAPLLQCVTCGKPPRCVNCDVPLTLHLQQHEMTCHYCGYHTPIPTVCPECGGALKVHGFGTERLEEEIGRLFPAARVMRMDLDTTRSKNAYRTIINAVANHEVDILIGTQMVTKGLHFDDVSLVAVLNADPMLNQPDFRSYERAYQMLEQVAGRAGRKGQQGEVFIQTFEPQNAVLDYVRRHDYEGLYGSQIADREQFGYPPFHRLIVLVLKHRNISRLEAASRVLQERLKQVFGSRVSGIIVPSVPRVRNEYVREIRLRIEASAGIGRAKALLREQIGYVQSLPDCKGTAIMADVDPM